MATEIEIKLAIEAPRIARLWRALARFDHDKPLSRKLFSAYYDTPDGVLHEHGVALRLRRDGRRWIQTLKSDATFTGGLHTRIEHDTDVPVQLPSFPAIAQAGFGSLLAGNRARSQLNVAFTTEFVRRSTRLLREDGGQIELCVDRGVIAAGDRREPICEIELELKAGSVDALFELAIALAQEVPLRLESRSKAERGFALAAGKAGPVKARIPALQAQMSAAEGCASAMLACLAQFEANEAGLLEGIDPEYLHQARVALRRLRSIYLLFETLQRDEALAQLMDRARQLGRVLGEARSLDVFVGETLAPALRASHPGMAAVRRRALALRRHAARCARAALADPAHTVMLLRLTRALVALQMPAPADPAAPQPAAAPAGPTLREFAAAALARQHARVRKRGRKIASLEPDALHRLRIAIKRLRYASEFFLPLAEPDARRKTLKTETALQSLLGRLNDDVSAWMVLDKLAAADASPPYQQAVGYLRGWCARDAEDCRALIAAAWKKYLVRKAPVLRAHEPSNA